MKITFTNSDKSYLSAKLKKEIKSSFQLICKDYQYKLEEVSIIFMNDDELLIMNKEHLNHDFYTDIITFDLSENQDTINAELYISIDRVKENAAKLLLETNEELSRVMLHGVLHLVGFRDKTKSEKIKMRETENIYLKKIGFHVEHSNV